MDRAKIEDALLAMGIPAGIKGFTYIADAIEILDKRGMDISVTKELYPEIAEKNNAVKTSVERAIRHAFEITRSAKADYDVVNHYIGFINCANSNSLMRLYTMLKRECEAGDVKSDEAERICKDTKPDFDFALEIRRILREELRIFFAEAKGV